MGIGYRIAFGITLLTLLCGSSVFAPTDSAAASKKNKPQLVTPDDYFRLGDVGGPRISPDGRWIAYTVGTQDLEADESSSRIWMVPAARFPSLPRARVPLRRVGARTENTWAFCHRVTRERPRSGPCFARAARPFSARTPRRE